MSEGDVYQCPECGGRFPHPVKYQTDWVCPWCYEEFLRCHTQPAYSYQESCREWRRETVAETKREGQDGE